MFTRLGLTIGGHIARLEFQRPETHNAFDAVTHAEFAAALAQLRTDDGIRAILLHAQGKTFVGGGNFDYLRQLRADPELRRRSYTEAYDIFRLLNDMPVPVIAAMQGHALGVGATIVTSCDIVVAWQDAKLADPHVRGGLAAGDGGAMSWASAGREMLAKRMVLTGDAITARQAHAIGLITDLVETPEQAYPAALALAERVASLPPIAIRGTKRAFNTLAKRNNAGALEVSMLEETISIMSDDIMEALAAASEKRPGRFRNR